MRDIAAGLDLDMRVYGNEMLAEARSLCSEGGENLEYDRGLAELLIACLGGTWETKDEVMRLLRQSPDETTG